jgi:hypothetical protein
MSGANIANLAVGIIVLALFLSPQPATRRLRENYRLPVTDEGPRSPAPARP